MARGLGSGGGRRWALVLCAFLVAGVVSATEPAGAAAPAGSVYTQTNTTPNFVQAWHRAPDGSLTSVGTFATGGNGGSPDPTAVFPVLDTQGSVVLHRTGRLL